jgi:hypothetical protein
MTVRPSLIVVVSQQLIAAGTIPVMRVAFGDIDGTQIRAPSKFLPDAGFLAYHNDSVFRG